MKDEKIHRAITDSVSVEPAPDSDEYTDLPRELVQRFSNAPFLGEHPAPDGYAYVRGDCGDAMEVFLSIRDKLIQRARFDTLGCGFTVACGSMAMELAEGKSLVDTLRITPKQISTALGGLPPSHEHCAELATEALKKAIEDYLKHGKDPWKKLYRNR